MKRVLVIGSTGLLGSEVVKALRGRAEVVEASFRRAPLKVDIADPPSLRRLFEKVGPVDGVVCTAGMARFLPWAQATDEDWAHGVANKLLGQVNVVRLGAPSVREGGAITLTTGVLAQHPMPGGAIFTTVNAAVEGFARAAAVELGTRVRVNVVSPGWITDTLRALGMDESIGLSAAQAAQAYVRQVEGGASGSVLVAAREG
jgi:NAD(P)-dependent dehydrogenase (short-subunit alcohol dehydrogenase family)